MILTSDRLFFLPAVDDPLLPDVAFWLIDITDVAQRRAATVCSSSSRTSSTSSSWSVQPGRADRPQRADAGRAIWRRRAPSPARGPSRAAAPPDEVRRPGQPSRAGRRRFGTVVYLVFANSAGGSGDGTVLIVPYTPTPVAADRDPGAATWLAGLGAANGGEAMLISCLDANSDGRLDGDDRPQLEGLDIALSRGRRASSRRTTATSTSARPPTSRRSAATHRSRRC